VVSLLLLWAKHSAKLLSAKNKHKESIMATVIRLTRMGRKKQPFYRIAVTDSRKRRDGGWIELIGYYNPMTEPATTNIDEERLNYWLGVGAQMSDRVKKLAGK